MNVRTALLALSVILTLPGIISASQNQSDIISLTAAQRATFLYLQKSLSSIVDGGPAQFGSIERYEQKALQQYNFARMLMKKDQEVYARKIDLGWAEQTAEKIKRDEFLSLEKKLEYVINHLGPRYFSNTAGDSSGRIGYEKTILSVYNRARRIMGQVRAKSVREVDFGWMQNKAKEFAPLSQTQAPTVNISGLDQKQVLRALFNAARPQAVGYPGSSLDCNKTITDEEAERVIQATKRIEYLKDRSMKLYFSGDQLDVSLYNRENGDNAAQNALKKLMDAKSVCAITTKTKEEKS